MSSKDLTSENDKTENENFSNENNDEDKSLRDVPMSDPKLTSSTEEDTTKNSSLSDSSNPTKSTIFSRYAISMARRPCLHLIMALLISITLSVIGFVVGNFSVSVDNAGWNSRGTVISNRESQATLVRVNRDTLFYGGVDDWEFLRNNVQKNWETDDDDERRRMMVDDGGLKNFESPMFYGLVPKRRLQDGAVAESGDGNDDGDGCDTDWYGSSSMTTSGNVMAIWKVTPPYSALDPSILRQICISESITQSKLESKKYCTGCTSSCLDPYSLVLMVRSFMTRNFGLDGFSMDCDTLTETYAGDIKKNFTNALVECVEDINENYDPATGVSNVTSCPEQFVPTVVDSRFGRGNEVVRYTSSYFATADGLAAVEDVYGIEGDFHGGNDNVKGVYDTSGEDFLGLYIDSALTTDMILAMASAAVTALAMILHTKSPWLSFIGLLQIILSFPLAYFVYTLIAQLDFFPFLNFIGIFVVFALGADDVFVAVDKWKNARLLLGPRASTEQVASLALPDAAGAMFLTTMTTAGAFFATTVCPVAPLTCFAVFCGLLIIFDYVMNIFLVFPALCLYDGWLRNGRGSLCTALDRKKRELISGASEHVTIGDGKDEEEPMDGTNPNDDNSKTSLIHTVLSLYYKYLNILRYPLLMASVAAIITSAIFASRISLPSSSDVALLDDAHRYEKHRLWKRNLLSEELEASAGSDAEIIWGLKPADTGTMLDPDSFTSLVLDDTFDPSKEDAQKYLLGFCDRFFATDFTEKPFTDYVCPMNAFDAWLQDESKSDSPSDAYVNDCNSTQKLPMSESLFDKCMVSWSKLTNTMSVLSENNKVQIITVISRTSVRWDTPFDLLDEEWNKFENYLEKERKDVAPPTVNKMFHTSLDFWWYDTNGQMLYTAQVASIIALAIAASIILFSSRSFLLTFYSIIAIGYVLAAAIASIVGIGWELGFLESICIAILIGISCDFVIHFSHAYSTASASKSLDGGANDADSVGVEEGNLSRHDRTKYAAVHMGPSILAAAATTFAAAIVMIFTQIVFFQKFAVVLFMTILHATIGSFVVFLVTVDCVGPAKPTSVVDSVIKKIKG